MGRDYYITNLIPRRPDDAKTAALPRGMTHPADAPCPFADDGLPLSSMGLCCSLRGEYLIADLEEAGEEFAGSRVLDAMSPDEALRFATTLRECADRIATHGFEEPEWAPFAEDLAMVAGNGKSNPFLRSMIDGPFVTIRNAANWYEKVARLGFGVECVR